MKVLKLQADNFKNLKAVEIDPDTNMVVVGGKNEQGKSSVMDAVWVALKGRAVAPPKPIRNGEEECRIRLDLGDLVVSRKFSGKEDGTYTDSVKVENADGLRYGKPQEVLDALLGEIGFDPFEFARMKPKDQAASLLQMVPLSVDLDELAQADTSDFAKRRDVNRDALQVKAQLDAIPKEDVPADAPDRAALVQQLGEAANINSEIGRERDRRESEARDIERVRTLADEAEAEAKELRERADRLEQSAKAKREDADARAAHLEQLEPLKEPVDTDAVRQQLATADAALATIERQQRRADLERRHEALVKESEGYTTAMADRATQRTEALRKAKMPIEGLEFVIDDAGKASVNLNGVPFEQASTAAKLRASTAIAMAANPELRILRISDGSLLDDDSMAMLKSMAEADDFQLWVEVVGEGARVGIVMENGEVRAAPAAKKEPAKAKAKAEPAEAKTDGALL